MTTLTRIEKILADANFGAAVITGFTQPDKAARDSVSAARKKQAEYRARIGYGHNPTPILTPGAAQFKLSKNTLPSFGMMLTPQKGLMRYEDIVKAFRITGPVNICPLASEGCTLACLSTSGQSGMPAQQRAQAARTAFLIACPVESGLIIGAELRAAIRRHGEINLRLNTTSDLRWEFIAPDMLTVLARAGVKMYDYTAWRPSDRAPSDIYSLTYSAKETSHTSDDYLIGILSAGHNVAMPFDTRRGMPLPATWNGFTVIDGDVSDERRLDPSGPVGVVVGLRAKGHAWKRDNTAGFIRPASGVPLPLTVIA